MLVPLGLGVVLAVGVGAPAALADEVDIVTDQITIYVTIDQFDPCAVGAGAYAWARQRRVAAHS